MDGNADDIFHLGTDNALTNAYAGGYGIYDLNTVAFEGGNGFLLDRPGRVVGAEVQWGNLSPNLEPVELHFWPILEAMDILGIGMSPIQRRHAVFQQRMMQNG